MQLLEKHPRVDPSAADYRTALQKLSLKRDFKGMHSLLNHPKANFFQLGHDLLNTGNNSYAIEAINMAIEHTNDSYLHLGADTLCVIAQLLHKHGKLDLADTCFQSSIFKKLDSYNSAIYARFLLARGQLEQCALYLKACRENVKIVNYTIRFMQELLLSDDELLKLIPPNGHLVVRSSWVANLTELNLLIRLNKQDEALQLWKGLEINSESSTQFNYLLYMGYCKLGQPEHGKSFLEKSETLYKLDRCNEFHFPVQSNIQ
jgi:hypothetical protein